MIGFLEVLLVSKDYMTDDTPALPRGESMDLFVSTPTWRTKN